MNSPHLYCTFISCPYEKLHAGVACVTLASDGWTSSDSRHHEGVWEVCVGGRPLGDNVWHQVSGGRQGRSLLVMVDDGISEDSRNESVLFNPLPPLHVDPHNGVVVGGLPELKGMEVSRVQHDLHHGKSPPS